MAYAPRSGRNGQVFVDIGAGLVELPGVKDWSIDSSAPPLDTTVMGDEFKTSVPDVPDFKCQLNALMNKLGNEIYAFADNEDHEMILYADRSAVAPYRHYWRGYVNADVSSKGGVGAVNSATINVRAGSGVGVSKYIL